ncbi:MAG: UvrD-helicase domain-containing protein [Pirellulales bacterium]|nr:UvrD-helicase domain-containing protein [Pirellulales bacterium]
MQHLVEGLTPAQREAVEHVDGPLLILAGPGSGKTRVVTHRIAHLLEIGIAGEQVLALTFTNKAAEEMRARVERLVPNRSVWLGTYHRFCARLLRRYATFVGLRENYTIYDAEDSGRALRRAIGRAKVDLTHFTPDNLAHAISWAKNKLITAEEYEPRPGNPLGALVKRVYPAYQEQLRRANAADFDDLLLHVAALLRENPEIRQSLDERYRYVLVDEYQDTNLAQYAIARALSIDYPNLAVTGDPDQSIYGWRGANLNNILEFEKDFPNVRVVRLERNYRSTKRILHAAAQLIAHNVKRKQKDLFTENAEGPPVRLVTYPNQKEEAQGIAARIAAEIQAGRRRARDFAVFYRVNALSRAFELALREQGIAYQVVNGVAFFERKEIKDTLAYLRLLNNPLDDVALVRVINTPSRGIGKTTLERIGDYAASHGLPLVDAARECHRIESLSKRAVGQVNAFVDLFDRLTAVAGGPVEEILGFVLAETGYKQQFEHAEDEEDQQRLANIEELLTVAREFDERNHRDRPLEEFLEETSLTNETDDWEAQTDRVTLMTLHASKGLEFPVVFLVAVEEGLLPHERSRDRIDQLEEERRLMFVGITRAQEQLQISMSAYRDFRGQRKMTVPSPFLMELPRGEMELQELEPVWTDPSYEAPIPAAPAVSAPVRRTGGVAMPQLTTAAEMANGGTSPAASPDDFCQGMIVRHPEYGLGRVVALSGNGASRQATIDFASAAGRKKFVIAKSPLRPVKQVP